MNYSCVCGPCVLYVSSLFKAVGLVLFLSFILCTTCAEYLSIDGTFMKAEREIWLGYF